MFDWVFDITDDNLFCSQNIAVIFLRSVDVKTTFRVDITNIIYAVVLSHTFVKVMQFLLVAFKTQQHSLSLFGTENLLNKNLFMVVVDLTAESRCNIVEMLSCCFSDIYQVVHYAF